MLFLGTVVISSPWSSMIRRLVLPSSMVTILPCVAEADLDALVGDLDAAPAGDFPLDRHAGGRQRLRTGEADALELVPLAGRDGTGQGAPQDAVLGEDVHDLVVEAEPGPLPGQRGADLDDLVAEGGGAAAAPLPRIRRQVVQGRNDPSAPRMREWPGRLPVAGSLSPGKITIKGARGASPLRGADP